jgi:hypothetical protein
MAYTAAELTVAAQNTQASPFQAWSQELAHTTESPVSFFFMPISQASFFFSIFGAY